MSPLFASGPADGVFLSFRRHPRFLRVVQDGQAFDVLDQLDDVPRDGETVSVYRADRAAFGIYVYVYEHMLGVDGEQLRDTAAWRAWVEQQTGERLDPTTAAPFAS